MKDIIDYMMEAVAALNERRRWSTLERIRMNQVTFEMLRRDAPLREYQRFLPPALSGTPIYIEDNIETGALELERTDGSKQTIILYEENSENEKI